VTGNLSVTLEVFCKLCIHHIRHTVKSHIQMLSCRTVLPNVLVLMYMMYMRIISRTCFD